MDDTDTLEHYGIKGMRWGFRRNSKGGYSRSGNRVKEVSEDAARAKAVSLKKKSAGIDSLSNKDIQDLVTRLNLEQQLTRLDVPSQSIGKQAVLKTLGKVGTQVSNQMLNSVSKDIGNAILENINSMGRRK